MPVVFPNTIVDGTVVDYAEIEENLAAWRDWLNAIPVTDIVAGSLTRETLARPRFAGWPLQGLMGEAQSMLEEHFGNAGPPLPSRLAWGRRADRITIKGGPETGDPVFRTKFGRTLILHAGWDHDVQVHVTGSYHVRTPNTGGGGEPQYPNGAGTGTDGVGYLKLYRLVRATGDRLAYNAGRVKLYPSVTSAWVGLDQGFHGVPFHAVFYERLTGGQVVDVFLGFEDASDGVAQVDLSELHMTCEVS